MKPSAIHPTVIADNAHLTASCKRATAAELRRQALELEALATLEECQAERLARAAKPNPTPTTKPEEKR